MKKNEGEDKMMQRRGGGGGGRAMDIGGMWHEEVQAGWRSRGIKMKEWKRGGIKQMSDSLTHPSALALSCTKPAR